MPNSTILANGNNYNKYMKCILTSKYIYGAAYNVHAPTPPKSFHPSVKKYTNGMMENIGVQMDKEMSIQNTEKKKNEGICSIRTIGNT